jgi:calcium permeable stress-gated cation channel
MIELFAQSAYFAFQVIQVFLVTTLTSAAEAALTKIIENPTSVRGLLSQNLPKASNFYTSYFLLQCLAVSANALVQFPSLIRFYVLQNSNKSPRIKYDRWHRLRRVHWSSRFPVFTNMGVIGELTMSFFPILCVST